MKPRVAAPMAALLAICSAWAQPAVRLKSRPASEQVARRAASGRGTHYILQFREYPKAAIRSELERRGIRVLEYVPDNGLMVSAREPDLHGLDLAWSAAMEAADKISPLLDGQSAGPVLVEFHKDVEMPRARAVVAEAGFDVLENAGLLPGQLVVSGALNRLESLAAKDEVAYLLPAAPELAAGEVLAGCAGAVTEAGAVGDYALVGQGWPKDAAGNVALKYFIRSLTDKMDAETARAEIERALKEWTRYANVTLSPGALAGAERNIDILFARGAHGDPYPFDGPGGTLAHTFYPAPPNTEPIAGDMHLDADESWRTGANFDLYSVALHEAGHALGLGHTDRPGAVMYPYYKLSAGLTDDDIAGIQALYGKAAVSTPAPPSTPVPSPTPTPPTPVPPPAPTPPVSPPGGDTVAPGLAIVSPGSTIVSTTAASLTFSGTASDNVGVKSVTWTTSVGESGTAAGTTAWASTVPLLVGTNVVTIRAWDAAGNSTWRAVTVVRR